MKTIEDFTPEIQAKIPWYIEKSLENVFDGGYFRAFNLLDAEAAVNWNYEKCGFKKPVVIAAENVLEEQLFYNFVDNNKEVEEFVVKMQEMLNTEGYDRVEYDKMHTELMVTIRDGVNKIIEEKNLRSIAKYNDDYLYTLNVYSNSYYWYYKFIKEEFQIPLSIEEDFETCFALQRKSGVYSAVFGDILCVVCKYPMEVHRNENNDLHCTTGEAVIWNTSVNVKPESYYINGRNVESVIFEKILNNDFTLEDFIILDNEDLKADIITILKENDGNEGLVKFLNAEVIDEQEFKHSSGHVETQKLWRTKDKLNCFGDEDGNQGNYMAWLEMICPTTGSTYMIDTLPSFTKVIEAAKYHRPAIIPSSLEYDFAKFNA